MKTLSRYAIALAAIVFCSISANAQRQSKLYIDDGHGSFETLSATLGGGSLTFPGGAAGTLLTTGNPTMITGVGIVTAGTWDGGIIQPIYGGTGLNSYVQGNILYASAANTLSALPPITNDGWVLTWNNTTTLPEWRVASGGGGGLAHITETYNNSTAPYSTGNAGEQLLASGTDANIDVALSPKGTGSIQANIADGTALGGNKRGQNAVDWQIDRVYNTAIAFGALSTISGGYANQAEGNYSTVSGGSNNFATGNFSVASGGGANDAIGMFSTVGGGNNSIASGDYSFVSGGKLAYATQYGQFAQASGLFTSFGSAQTSVFVARNSTSNATPANLYLDGSSISIAVPPNGAMKFHAFIVGKQTSSAVVGAWDVSGIIVNNGGIVSIVGTNVTTTYNTPVGWSVPTVTASGTNMILMVTGASSANIGWVARVETVEVIY